MSTCTTPVVRDFVINCCLSNSKRCHFSALLFLIVLIHEVLLGMAGRMSHLSFKTCRSPTNVLVGFYCSLNIEWKTAGVTTIVKQVPAKHFTCLAQLFFDDTAQTAAPLTFEHRTCLEVKLSFSRFPFCEIDPMFLALWDPGFRGMG